ncbi:MAG: SusC/RagA family TonB-linked outer membrane protein [Cytophagales bacterium]|nr:SusC/RagA family TonB-linked outer membrane protein [Cytophagales bacterium]
MKKFLLLIVMLLVLFYHGALAQVTVSGRVTDAADGSPIPGVNIVEKGTTNGTVSDFDGNYTLSVAEGASIVFSFVGYVSQDIAVNGRSSIDIALGTDVTQLSEVVVVGYGTVKKSDATGAVDVVDGEEFNKGFQTTPEQLIQGRVPGVLITEASGAPGAGSSIRIRGSSSIRAGNEPLIVLDGVPLDGRDTSPGADVGAGRSGAVNPLSFINPSDIESMSILKDASATAIYGSRGANGVIIITTKKGVRGKSRLEYNGSLGVAWIPENREYDLLSADEFRDATSSNPALDFGGDVDAFEEITRTALVQNHVLAYSGASETGNYRLSLSYQDQEGTIENTGLERLSASLNIGQKILDDRIDLQASIISSLVTNENTALSENVGAEGDLFTSALRWNPTRPFTNPDGTFDQPSDNQRNPLAFLNLYDDVTETSRTFANLSAGVKIIEGLNFKVNLGLDRSVAERQVAVSRQLLANFVAGGIGNIENITASSVLIENTLTYDKEIAEGISMNLLGGYSFQDFNRRGSNQRGVDFLYDDQSLYISNLNAAASFPPNENSSFEDPDDQLQSYFGRVNLDINQKFLITGTVRVDGSSRFSEGNEYGTFPSLAFGYRLSEEQFAPQVFSDLKFRLGWGVTGNRELPPGRSRDQFKPIDDGTGEQLDIVGNSNLTWEETTQWNVGFDYGFLDNKVTGTIDWYYKETENVLFRFDAAQPAPDAFFWQNLDDFRIINTGIDFALDAVLVDKADFTLNLGLNASWFDNEIEDEGNQFPAGIQTGEINGQGLSGQRSQLLFDGQELYAFYLPVFTGFNENGFATYADLDNNGRNEASTINVPGEGDRTFVGSPNPNYNLGIRASATYKNFDASIFFNGVFGHQVLDNTALALFSQAALLGGNNVDERVLGSGQAQGDAPIPSDRFLEDADFLRLANLTVGYNLNTTDIDWLSALRVYITGQNLFVLTGYDGFDPEVNVNKNVDDVPSFGIDYAAYPRARTITFGVNVTF